MTSTNQHPIPTGVPEGQQEQFLAAHPAAPQALNDELVPASDKSFVVTWLFAWLLGFFAVDRFYLGKTGTGLLKLFTFAGFGSWWLIDVILTLGGVQRDKKGRKLEGYRQHKKVAIIVTLAVTAVSLLIGGISGGANSADTTSASAPAADAPAAAVDEPAAEEEAPGVEEAAVETDTVQTWADDAFGAFAPVVQTGAGDNLVTLPAGATAGIVTATHDGSSNFSISVLDAANASTGQLLVNTIGAYAGTTSYGFSSFGDPGVTLQITADGNWSLTIAPISAAPTLAASGAGDAVFLYDGSAGKLTATHDGSSNFSIIEETNKVFNMGLLVNEIGTYSGTVPLSSGPSAITVSADGSWTMIAD